MKAVPVLSSLARVEHTFDHDHSILQRAEHYITSGRMIYLVGQSFPYIQSYLAWVQYIEHQQQNENNKKIQGSQMASPFGHTWRIMCCKIIWNTITNLSIFHEVLHLSRSFEIRKIANPPMPDQLTSLHVEQYLKDANSICRIQLQSSLSLQLGTVADIERFYCSVQEFYHYARRSLKCIVLLPLYNCCTFNLYTVLDP